MKAGQAYNTVEPSSSCTFAAELLWVLVNIYASST